MQDRFRFRVWYKSFGEIIPKMLYDAEQTYDYMYGEPEIIPAKSFGSVLDNEEEYIVMQCTGLKDKNGKLIYEGDLIEFTDNVNINGSKTHIAKVEHREEFNAYMYHAECMGWYTINPSQNKVFKVKVIGNIYENPELLEV